jgi:hypothetical protein
MCWHEPLQHQGDWMGVVRLLRVGSYRWAGASDSGLGLHMRQLMAELPVRVLIVERDRDEVLRSLDGLVAMQGMPQFLDILDARLSAIALSPHVLRVPFGALMDLDKVMVCLRHLMPGARPDAVKIAEMMRLNVQCDIAEMVRLAAAASPEVIRGTLGDDVAEAMAAPV